MNIKQPRNVRNLISALEAGGHEAYSVGGCVRNSMLGIPVDDWDICTSATPEEMKECLKEYKIYETGIKHGTLTVSDGASRFEVTTFRVEGGYRDGRHPDSVIFVRSIEEDLSRRDFTVNAMAYNEKTGVIDHHGGADDLEAGVIRAVGDPAKRFSEDGLRILRALRFASVLDFRIEEKTKEAILECRELLKSIAGERIRVELEKLLCGRAAARILDEFRDVIAVIIPELAASFDFDQHNRYHDRDVWKHTLASIDLIEPDPLLRMTMLLHDVGKPAAFFKDEEGRGHFKGHPQIGGQMAVEILNRLRYDKRTMSRIQLLIFCHDGNIDAEPVSIKKWMRQTRDDGFRQLMKVKMADAGAKKPEVFEERRAHYLNILKVFEEVVARGDCWEPAALAVNGNDIMSLGIPPGPFVGQTIERLLEEVVQGNLPNERDALLNRAAESIGGVTDPKKLRV